LIPPSLFTLDSCPHGPENLRASRRSRHATGPVESGQATRLLPTSERDKPAGWRTPTASSPLVATGPSSAWGSEAGTGLGRPPPLLLRSGPHVSAPSVATVDHHHLAIPPARRVAPGPLREGPERGALRPRAHPPAFWWARRSPAGAAAGSPAAG